MQAPLSLCKSLLLLRSSVSSVRQQGPDWGGAWLPALQRNKHHRRRDPVLVCLSSDAKSTCHRSHGSRLEGPPIPIRAAVVAPEFVPGIEVTPPMIREPPDELEA